MSDGHVRTPEQQAQARCPHPPGRLVRAEAWGRFGPWLCAIQCTLCGLRRRA